MQTRKVERIIDSVPTSDGAGVRLRRSLGSPQLPLLDPFLLLDEFYSDDPRDYMAGFPDHPHRGFETVTYMLDGHMEHRDSVGNRGQLVSGSVQWMTAGRGIIHSEMPKQEQGRMRGFQLWVNLPAKLKMTAPRYQDIAPDRIPEVSVGQTKVRVLAGKFGEARGPVEGVATDPTMLDVRLEAGGRFREELPASHTAFIYVFDGKEATVAGTKVQRGQLAVLGAGPGIAHDAEEQSVVEVEAKDPVRFMLLAAHPLGEPVARYGPFVMNTADEIRQAFLDYERGRLTA